MDKKEDYASAEYYLKVAKILAEEESNATTAGDTEYQGYAKRVQAEKDRHTKIYKKLDNPHGAPPVPPPPPRSFFCLTRSARLHIVPHFHRRV